MVVVVVLAVDLARARRRDVVEVGIRLHACDIVACRWRVLPAFPRFFVSLAVGFSFFFCRVILGHLVSFPAFSVVVCLFMLFLVLANLSLPVVTHSCGSPPSIASRVVGKMCVRRLFYFFLIGSHPACLFPLLPCLPCQLCPPSFHPAPLALPPSPSPNLDSHPTFTCLPFFLSPPSLPHLILAAKISLAATIRV